MFESRFRADKDYKKNKKCRKTDGTEKGKDVEEKRMADKRRIIKETVHSGSGEVHGVLSVVVDLNRFGQGLRVSAVALARHVAALRTATHRRNRN